MSELTQEQIREMAKSILGREIDPSEVETYRTRLPYLVRAKQALRDWAPRLADDEPATVHRLLDRARATGGGRS